MKILFLPLFIFSFSSLAKAEKTYENTYIQCSRFADLDSGRYCYLIINKEKFCTLTRKDSKASAEQRDAHQAVEGNKNWLMNYDPINEKSFLYTLKGEVALDENGMPILDKNNVPCFRVNYFVKKRGQATYVL